MHVQEMSTHTVSHTLCMLVCTVSLRLALSQFVVSFLSRWGAVVYERTCTARFRSGVLFGVLVAFAPISLGLLLFRGPGIVHRHVLPLNRCCNL